jgi:hypothetical protein
MKSGFQTKSVNDVNIGSFVDEGTYYLGSNVTDFVFRVVEYKSRRAIPL